MNELQQLESVIESLLFASGDVLSAARIAEVTGVDVKEIRLIVDKMTVDWENAGRGIQIRQIGEGYQLCTALANHEAVQKLFERKGKSGLSQAAYETLAVIAYKQPVTRAKVEQIRGVNSDSAFLRLAERGLIVETGRQDSPGRPILYETTEEFLRCFGFKTLADLPIVDFEGIYGM
jgi:segregation and condensation protein B